MSDSKVPPQHRSVSSRVRDQAIPIADEPADPWALTPQELADAAAIGRRLRYLRRTTRRPREPYLSQRVVAERAGLSKSAIGHIERGDGRVRASTLRRIADALAELRPRLGEGVDLMLELLDAGPHAIAPEKAA